MELVIAKNEVGKYVATIYEFDKFNTKGKTTDPISGKNKFFVALGLALEILYNYKWIINQVPKPVKNNKKKYYPPKKKKV